MTGHLQRRKVIRRSKSSFKDALDFDFSKSKVAEGSQTVPGQYAMLNAITSKDRYTVGPLFGVSTLTELARLRATQNRDERAYTFLEDGETRELTLTYGELDVRARAIGAMLQSMGAKGERVILLYDAGLDYLGAFFACLYASAIAVPAYPPRVKRRSERLGAVTTDSGATIALTTEALLSRIRHYVDSHSELAGLRWATTDTVPDHLAGQWKDPEVHTGDIAFLQYTSGSTSSPRGVILTHSNLLDNQRRIREAFEQNEQSIILSWLPFYHDMGLIGTVIQPLYLGARCILLSPMAFLEKPIRWLQAISKYKVTTSGGPNFAYDLCVRKTDAKQRVELDLSSWQVAFNGAEPVRAETLSRFADAFKGCGFRGEALTPCYGLAEATLLVAGEKRAHGPVLYTAQSSAFHRGEVVEARREAETRTLVGCGRIRPDQRTVIVDPKTKLRCLDQQVGEVWISGPSIAQGYWGRSQETDETFAAHLAGTDEGPFLRTGDMGFISDSQLFVTGRLKDLIIIRGKNHYPQDIEETVERSHASLRPGCGAAFSAEIQGEERLIVVHEADRPRNLDVESIIQRVRESVADEHDLHVHAVLLLRPGGIPKTSSGKIQRQLCRTRYLSASLGEIAHDVLDESDQTPKEHSGRHDEGINASDLRALPPRERQYLIEMWVQRQIAHCLGTATQRVDLDAGLNSLGMDSLQALAIKNSLETTFGIDIDLGTLLQGSNIRQIAQYVSANLLYPAPEPPATAEGDWDDGSGYPLSAGQEALWFLNQAAPDSPAYNIASAVLIHGDLDVPALRASFQKLVDRHAPLRTTFFVEEGRPVQKSHSRHQVSFNQVDASDWADNFLNARLVEESETPFDLAGGPLLRLSLFVREKGEHVLLLVIHHIVTDFWSLEVIITELKVLYAAEHRQASAILPPLNTHYRDYVGWQRERLAGSEGERLWRYWQDRLCDVPTLNLTTDHPRQNGQTSRGASCAFGLDADLTCRIRALSQGILTTVYTTLLTAFQLLLSRYTGQEDIIVGSPMTGRSSARFKDLVGYFVNPVPLRAWLRGDASARELIAQARHYVVGALEHQDYPFAYMVERLHSRRTPGLSPLFQVTFAMQKASTIQGETLGAFALGEMGASLHLADLLIKVVPLERKIVQFDIMLTVTEAKGAIAASLRYNSDLFDSPTMTRMAGHYQTLIRSLVADPDRAVSSFSILADAESRQILIEWNGTATEFPQTGRIHQLFEAQVSRMPDKPCLIFEGDHLSYGELNKRANQLAHYLIGLGVGSEMLVGICVGRALEMVVGILGILKTGAAYLPLDPAHPKDWLAFVLEDARAPLVVTQKRLLSRLSGKAICLDSDWSVIAQQKDEDPKADGTSRNLAYVIYTSGSTGKPKGVMITHRSVTNFFAGMDELIEYSTADTLLAVTSISFDISVLELFWTLTRGVRVVLLGERATTAVVTKPRSMRARDVEFSLFYFASDDSEATADKYRLLFEGAAFADQHGFEAVWTPERHFHAFGGLYPNSAVTGAALAARTERIKIRAGSVVLPLHHPVRVAEEWSLVDNLSKGRAGIAFASGWHADDFIFFPENYAHRKEAMLQGIETVKKLWRGESITARSGAGNEIEIRIFPKPVQPELPIWLTAAGSPDTFIRAGEIGANVLTHLLGQSIEELTHRINLYRDALAKQGHDRHAGRVTLMLHTFIGEDKEEVREKVQAPFTNYLRSSIGLIANLVKSLDLSFDLNNISDEDMDSLLEFAFNRYFETSALFGTPSTCLENIEVLKSIGVNEVACLIDFGVDTDSALSALHKLNELRELTRNQEEAGDHSIAEQAANCNATLMQCTPSMVRILTTDAHTADFLKSLRVLMLGGEALPAPLARRVKVADEARLINMYGPTETTIWSATHEVREVGSAVPIGRPIANTEIYILDRWLQPAPVGIPGDLYIGGAGLARGYFDRPDLTGERFIPNPLSDVGSGRRLYRTGDLARYLSDGAIEFLGRVDNQVKVRGFRIELEDVEATLREHQAVQGAVVLAREDASGDMRLVAYVVAKQSEAISAGELRSFVRQKLPEYMLPSTFVSLEALPMTPNGKVDRRALPPPEEMRPELGDGFVAPRTAIENVIAGIWAELLAIRRVGAFDDFFLLGGHSLLASRVVARVCDTLQVHFPLRSFLEAPTVASMAAAIESEGSREQKDIERIALLWLSVDQLSGEEIESMLGQE